ncbi:helix-turn-helix transcriptional regulator [Spongiactinospora sp. TRM90649]|uniref:helix-turn-helix domain-containing protein n=1 Tax=Spongiactinospora sp. TRM90649 TaxID=3031114 RepID=UPI0023FA0E55|nr:helix-turn-helix transcriptional regulator [Spongiactinospora sp. TRM90649]MDF5751358.1 helix-turn-helix transcriptional regulator [Spongiactinospora sp. TRM90649]
MPSGPPKEPSNIALRFGRELRKRREDAGYSQERVARYCGISASLVSSVERAARKPSISMAKSLDALFGLDDVFVRLADALSKERLAVGGPDWFQAWVGEIEPSASIIRCWDPLLITGLLQTEEYARAVISGDLTPTAEVDGRVHARMVRQTVLDREYPPELWVLLDEGALRRLIGTRKIMADQLDRILCRADMPEVTVQVVPSGAATTVGMMSGFIIAEGDGPTAVSIESAGRGEVSTEADLVSALWRRCDRLRAEAMRAIDSLQLIKEVRDEWNK